MATPSAPPADRALTPEQVEHFHRDGFLIVRSFFGPEEVEILQRVCDPETDLSEIQTAVREDTGSGRTYKVAIWTELDGSLFGKLPRISRVVRGAEALLGEPVYHWHSKLLRKLPGDAGVGIHQDYATWYEDGCLAPTMLSCTIGITKNDTQNGCVSFVPGSHKMARIHRVRLGATSDTHGPEPTRVAEIVRRNGIVHGELDPGDVIFFHCMTLHVSEPNHSERTRSVVHCSYNTISNQPIPRQGQAHHRFRPLELVDDGFLLRGDYEGVRRPDTFHASETEEDPGAGIFYRQVDQDVGEHTG